MAVQCATRAREIRSSYTMDARAVVAFAALAILAVNCQPTATAWVDVAPTTSEELDEVEKRYTPELVQELQSAKEDALLLYTEYSARAGADLKIFIRNISGLAGDVINSVDSGIIASAPESCRYTLDTKLRKVMTDSMRAASFSAENHHKFLLGHIIVFRMHLNKSEDYIQKCDKVIKECGIKCETTPKVKRWRRLAAEELHRVRDDMQHSRKYYRDILTHVHRKLRNIRKQANVRSQTAVEEFTQCSRAR